MAIRILSGENITGDITTSGKVNAGDRILTEATTSNALLQVKYNASNYLEAYYDTLNVVGGDFLIKRVGDTKIRLTAVGTTFTNLSNTSAASSSVDEVKIGTFGAGRPAIFLGSSNTTYTNSTWFIENIGASGKFRIGRNGLDILEIENGGASTFKGPSVTVLNASDPSVAVSDTDTNYKGIMTWRNSGSENVLEFVTRYAGTYYTNNLVLDRGNVGIGTASPDSKLDVKGPSATPADGNQTLSITNSTGGTQLNLGTAENSYGWIEAREGSTLRNLLINPNGGNVGIGTTSPGHLLDLYKSTSTTSSTTGTTLQRLWNYVGGDLNQQKTFIDFVFQDDNDNEYPQVRIGAEVGQNGDANTQVKEGSGAFVVYTNNATGIGPGTPTGLAERFRVDYQGKVGIGTTSPGAKLTVKGSGLTSQDFFHIEDSGGVRMLEVTSDAAGNAGLQVKNTSGITTSLIKCL